MATAAQDIVDAIDALILTKMEATTWDGLIDRRLGDLGITQSTTMRELLGLRAYYHKQASAESGGTEEQVVYL